MVIPHAVKNIANNRLVIFLFDFAMIFAMTFALLPLLNFDPYKVLEPEVDYSSADYFDRLYHTHHSLPVDTSLVIIATDGADGNTLASILNEIEPYSPAAIGLDLIFHNESSVTDSLLDALDRCTALVLPVELRYNPDDSTSTPSTPSLLNDLYPDAIFGTVSFPPRKPLEPQRQIYTSVVLADKSSIPSFAMAMAKFKNTGLAAESGRRYIDFNISRPQILRWRELSEASDKALDVLLRDKLVLLGDIDNTLDTHPTPVNHSMPGILVHAASITSLLHGKPIHQLGGIWMFILMTFFVGLVTVIETYCFHRDDFRKGLLQLTLKGLLIVIILFGGYALYIHAGVHANFSASIIFIFFSLVIADLWFGIKTLLKNQKQKRNEPENNHAKPAADSNDNPDESSERVYRRPRGRHGRIPRRCRRCLDKSRKTRHDTNIGNSKDC